MDEPVLLQSDGPIARLTLNQPTVMNALNRAMAERLAAVVTQIAGDPAVRVVVIGGAGDGFMAGGDIGLFKAALALAPADRRTVFKALVDTAHGAILGLRRLAVPVIASIHGPVAGFGMSLMMACDLAIASESAVFTLAYSQIGLSPDGGSTWFLPRHVGRKKAAEIALLGDRFDAATALRWGLVNEVVAAAELAPRVTALAERLARGPSQAYAATKRLLDQSAHADIETQLEAERESLVRSTTTADFAEGVEAFLARRLPRFRH